jgi:nitrate reductase cytochrome c-type subunit
MSKKVKQSKASVFVFISIIAVMIGVLAYGFSVVETDYIDGPKERMTEECKKLWLEKGEEEAVKNGC